MRKDIINEAIKLKLGEIEFDKYGPKSIGNLNYIIKDYLLKIYTPFGFNDPLKKGSYEVDLNINGEIINSSYISKLCNNYNLFKLIIRKKRIKTEDEFYNYIENNLEEIYHYDSDFFKKNSLPTVIKNSTRGNIGEEKSLKFFEYEILRKTQVDIKVIKPSLSEDLGGIDGKFLWKGKMLTIQVKPFEKYIENSEIIKVYSPGSLSLNTDYLILYRSNSLIKYIIIRSSDVKISGNNFIFNKESIINK